MNGEQLLRSLFACIALRTYVSLLLLQVLKEVSIHAPFLRNIDCFCVSAQVCAVHKPEISQGGLFSFPLNLSWVFCLFLTKVSRSIWNTALCWG